MHQARQLKGLYAITQPHPEGLQPLLIQVEAALIGGTRIVQYRDKQLNWELRQSQAEALLALCRRYGALLIINDDPLLAKTIGADGVHVGREDQDIRLARRILGHHAIIGTSCYDQLSLAISAEQAGADYVAFGRFYPSKSKPQAVQADPALLTAAREALLIPVVAIGGITPENGGALIRAGADMLAVIDGIFGQPDITASCQRFNQLFDTSERVPS